MESLTTNYAKYKLTPDEELLIFSTIEFNTGHPNPTVMAQVARDVMPKKSYLELTPSCDLKAADNEVKRWREAGLDIGLESEGRPFFYEIKPLKGKVKVTIARR